MKFNSHIKSLLSVYDIKLKRKTLIIKIKFIKRKLVLTVFKTNFSVHL